MTRRSWMILLLVVVGASMLGISISAKRMRTAAARVASAQQAVAATIRDAREVLNLRSQQQTIQLRQRPAQDVIAQVNAVLADAGIPASRFKSLTPESESSVATANQDAAIKQQSLRLTLENLSLAEIGGFLNQWRMSGSGDSAIWTPTRMELTHVRASSPASSNSGNYDFSLVLTALYLADPT